MPPTQERIRRPQEAGWTVGESFHLGPNENAHTHKFQETDPHICDFGVSFIAHVNCMTGAANRTKMTITHPSCPFMSFPVLSYLQAILNSYLFISHFTTLVPWHELLQYPGSSRRCRRSHGMEGMAFPDLPRAPR